MENVRPTKNNRGPKYPMAVEVVSRREEFSETVYIAVSWFTPFKGWLRDYTESEITIHALQEVKIYQPHSPGNIFSHCFD